MSAEISDDIGAPSGGLFSHLGDRGLRLITTAAALLIGLVLALIVYETVKGAWPAISEFGLGFLTADDWNPVTDKFGARALIYGTLFTSIFALLLAVPIGLAIGLFLSELAPGWVRTPIGMLVELLAAIPSVILGLWGVIVMGPFVATHIEPWLHDNLGFIPLFNGYPSPAGLLPAILILTIMVIPIVASISRELFQSVPSDLKQGAMALGATRWEMIRSVAVPQVGGGLVAGTMLGFGRAIGEAIAVAMVIGGSLATHTDIFSPADTLASRIASQYQGAATSLQKSSLTYLAVILLVISLITNVAAQLIVRRMNRKREARA